MYQFNNRVWLYGERAKEIIKELKKIENRESSIKIEKILNNEMDNTELYYGDYIFGDNYFEVDVNDGCVHELLEVCKTFGVSFKIRYDDYFNDLYGVGFYSYYEDMYKDYDLNETEIMRVESETIANKCSDYIDLGDNCVLEGIKYNCVFEAFDVLLERKSKEFNLDFISETVDNFATTIYDANPLCDKDILNYYEWKIVILKLEELIAKYNAQEYIKVDSPILNEVFKNYHHEGIFDYINREYSSKIKEALVGYKDYYEGMENSSDINDRKKYLDIFRNASEYILDDLSDLGIDAFNDWQVNLKLFFLLLVDKNNIIPSKEMFKDFMDNPEIFTRDIKLTQLLKTDMPKSKTKMQENCQYIKK